MNIKISIIIIVKNDRGIAKTLKALKKIKTSYRTEIIVVDASEIGALADIRSSYPNIKWIPFKAKKGPKSSIPEQRNIGVRASKGKIVVFIDANCVPVYDWLPKLVRPIIESKESITAGSVTAQNPKTHVNLNRADRKR